MRCLTSTCEWTSLDGRVGADCEGFDYRDFLVLFSNMLSPRRARVDVYTTIPGLVICRKEILWLCIFTCKWAVPAA